MRIFKEISKKLNDPLISYEERTMIMLALLGETTAVVALLFDILCKEHIVEILVLALLCIGVPLLTTLSIKHGKIFIGSIIQVLVLVCVVLPVTFFFGGGPEGGGVFWVIFSYMFIGMSLPGALRVVMMVLLTAINIAEYVVWYIHPEYVKAHDTGMFFIDALVSITLVGYSTFAMLRYQKRIFAEESKRAQEQALRAEELNRSQNQFFSSMSHEIRTPINSILGLNEIILRQEDASEEIKKDAANIQGAGKLLLALVNDILDLSKIEAGKMDIVPVNYSVSSLVSDIVNMIWLRAEEKGLKLKVDIDPSIPCELYGDEVRIKQILVNLLNNAVKYTKEGTVTLHIDNEEIFDERALIVFTVTDTGMGIKQEALPHLFDAFQRADEEKNRYIEGTGLGLSIVKMLVDLMKGTISVNSVYTQGSTFTVSIWQPISNKAPVGEINIESLGNAASSGHYESSFMAPSARILIVDDNEMNIEVEKKLLADTGVKIETATSGETALELTARIHYDVILMDHLMPGMDGIECLLRIRKQSEEINNNTPVIVLTANAGAENKELYSKSGFDGYLLKPVSGRQLEDTLLRVLPEEKVSHKSGGDISHEVMSTAKGYRRKVPVLITTSSMCDLPATLIREMQLDIISFFVRTSGGAFWDNVEADADELVQYMNHVEGTLKSEPPRVEEFETFFAKKLRKAHHIIHIAITPDMSEEYERACKAAKQFDNVTVVDSTALSSATGLLVMIAYQMAQQNMPVDRIVMELNEASKRIHCGFIVGGTEFLMRGGFISDMTHRLMTTMNLRPALRIKDGVFGLEKIYVGERKESYRRYIRKTLGKGVNPDKDILFITYVDLSEEDLDWIADETRKIVEFRNIVFQKASAAISVNCGPGSFGLLFIDDGEKSYHLGNMLPRDRVYEDADEAESGLRPMPNVSDAGVGQAFAEPEIQMDSVTRAAALADKEKEPEAELKGDKWYENIEGLNAQVAIKNSGSEDALLTVLQIFYDSIEAKYSEIVQAYSSGDFKNYTIKVHALKSSAKLIGAIDLATKAEMLEMAGKAGDIEFINNNNDELLREYGEFKVKFAEHFDQDIAAKPDDDRPVADKNIMDTFYEALLESAEEMDIDMIEASFKEMEDYAIPEDEVEKYQLLKENFDRFDYEAMISLLKDR